MKKYLDLAIANDTIKTTDIKGKNYAEVNQRIKAFRMNHPNGSIATHIESLQDGVVVMSCEVKDENGALLGKAYAYEKENSSFINKTSFIENCCTSCTGRALGYAGYGIDVSVASAEEVQNAIENQKVTQEDADNYKLTFGKYKGMTIKEIQKEKPEYIDWLLENTKDENMIKIIELASGKKILSAEEMQEKLTKMNELNNLLETTGTDRGAFYLFYKVKSNKDMTIEQLNDGIEKLKKRVQ